MKVTTYNFFKVSNTYQFVNDGKLTTFSNEMFSCLLNQYKIMGYKVILETDYTVSITKIENEIENFICLLNK
jgi:hypothetical protein